MSIQVGIFVIAVRLAAVAFLFASGASLCAEQYAFLVGVRDYSLSDELRSLEYSENDIHSLADTLHRSGIPAENLVLMTQKMSAAKARLSPRADQIRRELDLLLSELDEDDSIIVAFAGHGLQFRGESVNYFCPIDARIDDKSTLISLSKVYQQLNACRAQSKLLLVDACRDDPINKSAKSPRRIEIESVSERTPPVLSGGTVAIFSCSASEASFEHQELKSGVFFYFVNSGALAGEADDDENKVIDLLELEYFTIKSVKKWARLKLGKKQTPERRGTAVGAMKLVDVANGTTMSIPSPGPNAVTPTTFTNEIGMKMIFVPPGSMTMGGRRTKQGSYPAGFEPPHRVVISKPFYIGETEVTQAQWKAIMRTRPWADKQYVVEGPEYPATFVTWEDAIEFCALLSAKEGRQYTLPTEAEWEFACRASTDTAYSFESQTELGEYAWYAENAGKSGAAFPHPVRQKLPNGLGLYDMHGNVWEWVNDWYHERYGSQPTTVDPAGPPVGSQRVVHGGGWNDKADRLRCATRTKYDPSTKSSGIGFRVRVPLGE